MKTIEQFVKSYLAWILALVIILPHLIIAFAPANNLLNFYNTDDAFYYFKVAQNIASGLGSTFDGINLTNGYHPLWMLICIPIFSLARFDPYLPLRIMVMVAAGITAASSVMLFKLGKRVFSTTTAAWMAMFWALYDVINNIVTKGGMEAGISGLFIILLLYRLAVLEDLRKQRGLTWKDALITGIFAALALFSRLDNIFLVAMAGIWVIFQQQRTRQQVLGDIVLIPFGMLAAFFTVLPSVNGFYTYATAALWMIAAAMVVKLTIFWLAGYDQDQNRANGWLWLFRTAVWVGLSEILVAAVIFAADKAGFFHGFPRLTFAADAIITFIWVSLTRWFGYTKTGSTVLSWRERLSWKQILPTIQAGIGYAAVPGTALVVYTVWNKLVFGSWTPVSGQIKHWWASLANPIYGDKPRVIADFFGLTGESTNPWMLARNLIQLPGTWIQNISGMAAGPAQTAGIVVMIVVFGGMIWLMKTDRRKYFAEAFRNLSILPLLAAVLFQSMYYPIEGYLHTRDWYWTAEMILTVLVLGILFETIWRGLSRVRLVQSLVFIALFCCLIFDFSQGVYQDFNLQNSEGVENGLIAQISGLEKATEPGARIGTTGGGVLAYFIQGRTIVNLDGLMNSTEYFKMMQNKTAYEYLNRIHLDYVYKKEAVLLESDPYRDIFTGRIVAVDRIEGIPLYKYLIK